MVETENTSFRIDDSNIFHWNIMPLGRISIKGLKEIKPHNPIVSKILDCDCGRIFTTQNLSSEWKCRVFD